MGELIGSVGPVGVVGVDMLIGLPAGVVAWTARRECAGTARSLPDQPEVSSDVLAAAIWV